ncbi:MAG TPA: methyltransferase domain-containing protein [Pyrinomonadaceae bacterium]|nr:methyltransferase domain-containing protein [Pyrinomonadaceae bacterium]
MRLAYFSPFGPQKSGIADYSEELLPHLARRAEVDLFVEGFTPSARELTERFRVFDYVKEPALLGRLREDYDAALYHLGNDHRYHAGVFDALRAAPGVVVLHDFALQDFFLGLARARGDFRVYLDELEACHGREARASAEEALARGAAPPQASTPLLFPMNARIAREAVAVIVHSEWSRERLRSIAPQTPVARVNHHITERAARGEVRRTTPAADGRVEICSFGLITPDKGVERALRVLASLRHEHDFHYTLVGAPNSFFDVREIVRRYDLADRVTVTGHVSLEEFQRRIASADIAVNLRERTVGETSGSLCRIMAAGVAAVVSNVGWFSELPDAAVVKVDMDECADALLRAYLKRLIEDAPLRARLGANARRHVLAEHDIERSAEGYVNFVREVVAARPRRAFVAGVSSELTALGTRPGPDDALLAGVAAEVAALAPAHVFKPAAASSPEARTTPPDHAKSDNGAKSPAHAPSNSHAPSSNGRTPKVEGIDYKRAAVEYPRKLDAERHHYLLTKPFYNLANKPPKHAGDGMDVETHRHFCDFANVAVALALPAGARLLDVGCGSGWLSEYFARLGYDVTGIDISPDLIRLAEERVARVAYGADHETPLRCRFAAHDVESGPLAEEFDAVVCYDSLHHFEDERAVMRHLRAMVRYGGLLFILEGDKPEADSATEHELTGVMLEYETLESPFSRGYLRALLDEHGFAVVGDFVSVNGLFERDALEGGRLPVEPPEVNYLLCKKVAAEGPAARVPDSREPGRLAARVAPEGDWPAEFARGATIEQTLAVENAGDTLWLTGHASRRGSVMLGARVFDAAGRVVFERHGDPPLARALAPGERVRLRLELPAPTTPGDYELKLDFVAQHVCWFEQRGSEPLVLPLKVV